MKILKLGLFIISFLIILSCEDMTSPGSGDAPFNFKVQKTSEGIVRISWSYNSGSELEFHLDRKVGDTDWEESYAVIESGTFQYYDEIPTSDTKIYGYKVRVYFIEEDYYSNYSEAKAYFSENTIPDELEIELIDQSSVQITWQDRCIGEDGYYVDKKTNSGSWQNKYFKLAANTETITDEATLFDTLYYRVSAYFGTSSTATVEDSIFQNLMSPSDLKATILDYDKIRLSWTDNSIGEYGFLIDRKVGEYDWQINYAQVDSNIVTYVDDISLQCATLLYRVRAFKDEFYSAYSPEVSINIHLEIIGIVNTPGAALDVFFENWNVFVADEYYGLAVIDCFNPNLPQLLGNYNLADRTLSSYVIENIAYISTHSTPTNPGRIHKVDISNITEPVLIGFSDTQGIPKHLHVDGDFAFIAEGNAGLSIIYVAGSNLYPVSSFPTNDARDVFIHNNFALVANGSHGLKIVDVLNPNNPTLISELSTSGSMIDIHVVGNYAYVADGESGMKIIDISDIYNPFVESRVRTEGFVFGVWAEEDFAYIVDKELGFFAVDVHDPDHPKILGSIEMNTQPIAITVTGSYAYITDNEGLKIIQVKP